MLVCDRYNNQIRKVTIPDGVVSTFEAWPKGYQNVSKDSNLNRYPFYDPLSIIIDPGNVFALVTDSGNKLIRKITISTKFASRLAGGGPTSNSDGIGTNVRFQDLKGISLSSDSSYALVIDRVQIRKIILSTSEVTTFAGSTAGYANGIGSNA